MPVFEYKCKQCSKKIELFVKSSQTVQTCKECGGELERVYSGKMFGATGCKGNGCSGNCSTCSGCK